MASLTKPDLVLDLSIKNFGPITNGDVSLRPLTVFVGPNNSGKSYAARLIHSIVDARFSEDLFHVKHRRQMAKLVNAVIADNEPDNKKPGGISLELQLRPDVLSNVKQNFLSDLKGLINADSDYCQLGIATNTFKTVLEFGKKTRKNPGIVKSKFVVKLDENTDGMNIQTKGNQTVITAGVHRSELSTPLAMNWIRVALEQVERDSYYLPASRSGILQTHKTISASIMRSLNRDDLNLRRSGLPGIVANFIAHLIECPLDFLTPYAKIAQDMEDEIFGGEIRINPSTPLLEITYKQHDLNIPLHMTSSTISELAPLTLYLKYIVTPGSLLVIEEPEAHLHPGNQVTLARYLVRLVQQGLNVLVTTHSPFLLEELSHLLEAGKLTPGARRERLGYADAYMRPDKVAVYGFEMNNQRTTIKELSVSDDGIDQEEFVRISTMLYKQLQSLRR